MTTPGPRSPELQSAKSPLARSVTTPNLAAFSTFEIGAASLELPQQEQYVSSTADSRQMQSRPTTRPIYTFQRNFTWPPALSVANTDLQFGLVVEWLQKCADAGPEAVFDAELRLPTVRFSLPSEIHDSSFGDPVIKKGPSRGTVSAISSRFSTEQKKETFRSAVRRRWIHFAHKSKEKPLQKQTSDSKHSELDRGRSKNARVRNHPKSSLRSKSPKRTPKDDSKSRKRRSSSSNHKLAKKKIKLPAHELSTPRIHHQEQSRSRPRPIFTAEGQILLGGEGPLWEAHGAHHRRSRTLSGHRHVWREVAESLFTINEEVLDLEPGMVGVAEHARRSFEHGDEDRLIPVGGEWEAITLAVKHMKRLKEGRGASTDASNMVKRSAESSLGNTAGQRRG